MKISLAIPVLVFVSSAVLLACTEQSDQNKTAEKSTHAAHGALPLPKRLAFMTGHVKAGLALYRAGVPEMAAPHLLHPVSETHASERVGLDALGFDGSLFEAVSVALEQGRPASELEPQLRAAEANLAMLATKAGGDPVEIINYLLDTILEEYAIGVSAGRVTDIGEYQDAFGFTVVAIDQSESLARSAQVSAALQELLSMWPTAPIPDGSPSSLQDIDDKVKAVRAALP